MKVKIVSLKEVKNGELIVVSYIDPSTGECDSAVIGKKQFIDKHKVKLDDLSVFKPNASIDYNKSGYLTHGEPL